MASERKIFAWVGFSDGSLHFDRVLDSYCDADRGVQKAEIYKTRKEAQRRYEDVRQVEIRIVRSKKP